MDGEDATDEVAQSFIKEVARETKSLNELVKAGQTFIKMK